MLKLIDCTLKKLYGYILADKKILIALPHFKVKMRSTWHVKLIAHVPNSKV